MMLTISVKMTLIAVLVLTTFDVTYYVCYETFSKSILADNKKA